MNNRYKKLIVLFLVATMLIGCASGNNSKKENDGEKEETRKTVVPYQYNQELNMIDDNYRNYYEVFLYSFCDSNQDGVGDINGLISKLDYINDGDPKTDTDLGFNGIWLMPIMPSTTYHKYDVVDYYSVDKEYGSIDDFKNLIAECKKRGIKVIIDLVMNHTSAKNPWFIKATEYLGQLEDGEEPSIKECPYFDYYNFVREEDAPANDDYVRVGNTDWYYQCVFWDQMPDLNLASKAVRQELEQIADYWMELGVGGFRLDAAKEFYSGQPSKNIEVLSWFNDYVKSKDENIYIVAEIWDSLGVYTKYYQSGIDSVFDFAFAEADGKIATTLNGKGKANSAKSFGQAMVKVQDIIKKNNPNGMDAPFFTNHDLDRAAGYFNYDDTKIKMAGAMNILMSGSSFVYYGEEIGMSGSGRDENKRAPMYWSSTDQAGMTKGPKDMEKVEHRFASLDEQQNDPLSIYNFYKSAIQLRNENPEVARGIVSYLDFVTDETVAAISKTYEDSKIVIIYNITEEEKKVKIPKSEISYQGIRGYLSTNGQAVTIENETLTMPAYSIVILK